jgi:hydroxyacylglutathione hydrolase
MLLNDHSDAEVHFLQIHLGGDRNWCYLLGDRRSGEGAVVDPGFDPDALAAVVRDRQVTVRFILLTHGHGDHTGGAARLAELTGATLHAHADARVARALPLQEGAHFALGHKRIISFLTPGHAPGHMVFLFEGRLLTGDLLFCGKIGGTGPFFAGSSGHDYYGGPGSMTHSTIGHERTHNPFLACTDFNAFCLLKENWDAYKKEHGIR